MAGTCSGYRLGSGGPMRPSLQWKNSQYGFAGSGGALWVSKRLFGVVYFDLGDGGGVFDNRFVFSAPMVYSCLFCVRWVL